MRAPKIIEVKKDDAPAMVADVARQLRLPLDLDCNKAFLQLVEPIGQGEIMSYETTQGLDCIMLDCYLEQPIELRLQGNFAQPLIMITVARGRVEVATQKGKFAVNELQGTIHGAYGQGEYTMKLPGKVKLLMLITLVHRKTFFQEISCGILQVPPELLQVIKGKNLGKRQFLFQDIYHLPAVDQVHSVIDHQETGLLHSTHASAALYQNMYLLLNEYKRVQGSKNSRLVRDVQKIETIRAAETILVSHLQDPPTIPMLSKMVGINQQTLKTGFRQLYGKTINNYLNDLRLEQAGILISAGELSIGEIANAVGYSNGGYFSRKFKQKYGVTPSKFA